MFTCKCELRMPRNSLIRLVRFEASGDDLPALKYHVVDDFAKQIVLRNDIYGKIKLRVEVFQKTAGRIEVLKFTAERTYSMDYVLFKSS